jgi:transcriptional regulator with XRE-family HTH domain
VKDEFHWQLRERRVVKGMSEGDVAFVAGLSANEYYDLEHDSTEWRMVTPLFTLKFLIRLLHIEIDKLILPPSHDQFDKRHSAAEVITARRSQLNLSKEEFAERAGFYPVFAKIVEGHPDGLELYPAEVAVRTARALEINPDDFVRWIISK